MTGDIDTTSGSVIPATRTEVIEARYDNEHELDYRGGLLFVVEGGETDDDEDARSELSDGMQAMCAGRYGDWKDIRL